MSMSTDTAHLTTHQPSPAWSKTFLQSQTQSSDAGTLGFQKILLPLVESTTLWPRFLDLSRVAAFVLLG